MLLGLTVLLLLAIRLVVRWRIKAPAWATTGSSLLDRIGRWTHIALYFLAFAVSVTGLILALQTNRLARVFSPPTARQFGPGQFQPGQVPPQGFQPASFLPAAAFAAKAAREALRVAVASSWALSTAPVGQSCCC